jgi:tetratricopeptide (TPR) repeat protein
VRHSSAHAAEALLRRAVRRVPVVLGLLVVGCASIEPSPRTLHYVDDTLVHSRAPHASAYEAYLRARIAFEASPPRLEEAMQAIGVAIHYHPREPQLWTTRAEIEAAAGDYDRAMASAGRALELRPGYGPAQQLVATLGGAEATAAAPSGSSAARQP